MVSKSTRGGNGRHQGGGAQEAQGVAPGGDAESVTKGVAAELVGIALSKLRDVVAVEPKCFTKKQARHAQVTFHGVNTVCRAMEVGAPCECEGE